MPPIFDPPVCAVNATSTTLMSADGSRFVAFRAQPQTPSGVGIVLLPDLRGLSTFYEKLAIRLAEQGHTALAIDYFGRTAGTGPREAGFPFMEHLLKVTRTALHDDIEAAAESLRTHDGGNCRGVLALGFCFGGRQAFFAAAPRFKLAGVIGFYGAISFYPNGASGPLQAASELRAPILAIFGRGYWDPT